jgi:glycosyltransferase involved in cell wall biosynthesis
LPTLHTLYCPIPDYGGRWRVPGVHALIRRWANRLDWQGGISRNVVNSLTHYGVPRAAWVPPALDLERFTPVPAPATVRERLGVKLDELMVLFVGNAKPQKNAVGALRATQQLRGSFPNMKLVVTTELKRSSSDADLSALARTAEELDLKEGLVQVGIVDNMPDLMRSCDVLVAPFLDTVGPSDYFMAALEAMACGKPVVVSNVGGMPEVVSTDVGRLVDPHDCVSIAAGLRPFLADAGLRIKAGANARKLVENMFHPDKVSAVYEGIYEGIAA